jgi:hypothetical protein
MRIGFGDGAGLDWETGDLPAAGAAGAWPVNRPSGTTELDAGDGGPAPIAFVAVTVNVYEVPLSRPSITAVVTPAPTTTWPAGEPVTV